MPLFNAPPPPPPSNLSPIVGAGDISIWDASASLLGRSADDSGGSPAPARAASELACDSASSRSVIGWWTCWLIGVSRETKVCSWGAGVVGVTSPDGGAARKPSETLGGSKHDTVAPCACSPSATSKEKHWVKTGNVTSSFLISLVGTVFEYNSS